MLLINLKDIIMNNRLVWIDLEMTGLNPHTDVILEVATIITDSNLTVIANGPELIIQQPASMLESMDPWVHTLHKQSGLLEKVRTSSITSQEAERQTISFIQQYCTEKTALLCGNSVWQDKAFLQQHMPSITNYLHYRIIDVTTIKELVTRWYPTNAPFTKKEKHRALDDIQESIAELTYYRKQFFIP